MFQLALSILHSQLCSVYTYDIIPLQFQLYGEPVVKACIDQKCHYIDVSGETYVSEQSVSLSKY